MYYQSALSKTISFVEHNLCESFSLEELTEINGFSKWHFSRVFHLFTGYSISEYIRGRRLSEAARELVETDNKIIDIAFDYQFSSQDAFTRSFTSSYGISPGRFRKLGQRKILINPLDVSKIIWMQGGLEVKPEIIMIDDLKVMGLVYKGQNQNQEIGMLWQEFLKEYKKLSHQKIT
ncbi:MAG: AraC family transcriptional regulator [Clostridiales bacterium]|nr:AraC family transcriptional regulator [Clostridiales bacterium]